MLFENPKTIIKRQDAARKWIQHYTEKTRNNQETGEQPRALAVIVLTERTSDFLAQHDPQALKQAQLALDDRSYEHFMS